MQEKYNGGRITGSKLDNLIYGQAGRGIGDMLSEFPTDQPGKPRARITKVEVIIDEDKDPIKLTIEPLPRPRQVCQE